MLASAYPKPPPRKVIYKLPKPTPRVKIVAVENPISQASNVVLEDLTYTQQDEDINSEIVKDQISKYDSEIKNNNTNKKFIEEYDISINSPQLTDIENIHSNKSSIISMNSCESLYIPSAKESIDSTPSKKYSISNASNPKQSFSIGTSMLFMNENEDKGSLKSFQSLPLDSVSLPANSSTHSLNQIDDYQIEDFDINLFRSATKKTEGNAKHHQKIYGIYDLDTDVNKPHDLESNDNLPSFLKSSNIKKWNNVEQLDAISVTSGHGSFGNNRWVIGETSDTGTFSY